MFAQLTVGGKWEGPHVFVVRLRDDQGQLTPGVRIRDNGPKAGLNGVDNGQIWCAALPACRPCSAPWGEHGRVLRHVLFQGSERPYRGGAWWAHSAAPGGTMVASCR